MDKKYKALLLLSTISTLLCSCKTNTLGKDVSPNLNNTTSSEVGDASGDITGSESIDYSTSEGNYTTSDGDLSSDDSIDITITSEALLPTMAADFGAIKALDGTKQGWGQGVNKNEKNQPTSSIDFQKKYGKYDAFFIGDTNKDKMYLTFDEGYENGYTAPILDILKQKKVSAVFFVTYPYAKENPDLIDRMIKEGHIVGNHSVKHPSFPSIPLERARNEVTELHDYIKKNHNYDMNLFRFPAGEFNEQTLQLVKDLGYKSIFWSYAYVDWDPNKQMAPDVAKKKLLDSAHQGAIYLLHAVSKTNIEILGDVIDELRTQGYEISKFDL